MTDLAFGEDEHHINGAAGFADVRYDFYDIGQAGTQHGSLNQSGYLFDATYQRRVAPNFYIGVRGRYVNVITIFDLPALAGSLAENGGPLAEIREKIGTIGLIAHYDFLNKDCDPTDGVLVEGSFEGGTTWKRKSISCGRRRFTAVTMISRTISCWLRTVRSA
jgi:hypothetical protein